MQLTLWTYEGPPHIGAMRICAAMKGVHYVLHAPQGDTQWNALENFFTAAADGI